MSEQTNNNTFSQGWDIVKTCNEAIKNKDYTIVRQQMAAYFKLLNPKQGYREGLQQGCLRGSHKSNLHSAILSIAVKLGTLCPDFHLVPFLNLWNLANLRPEDSDDITREDGKRIPSLVERLARSYSYALLFHPEEHIEPELEDMIFLHLRKKGFLGTPEPKIVPLLAIRLIKKEVQRDLHVSGGLHSTNSYQNISRTMTFVSLIASNGTEFLTEVHTLTAFQRLRYEDIPGMVFDTLLRTVEKAPARNTNSSFSDFNSSVRDSSAVTLSQTHIRIEAAIPTRSAPEASFPTKVGYVEFLDLSHGHTHIYDNESRHLVAEHNPYTTIGRLNSSVKVGDYVAFIPIIPLTSNFKTAVIRKVLTPEEGPSAFGLRKAKVQYLDPGKGYAAWELLPEESIQTEGCVNNSQVEGCVNNSQVEGCVNNSQVEGCASASQIRPIIETGTTEPSFTKGYINQTLATALNKPLPQVGSEISIIVYLKRGRDKQKRPHVIYYK